MNECNLNKTIQINSINDKINQSENKISIIFISNIDPINKIASKILVIKCGPSDEISELIEKYFEKAKINEDYKKYFKFIFNANALDIYSKSKIKDVDLCTNANIFVIISIIKINFKISNNFLYIKKGICFLDKISVNELIKDFLDDSGIKDEDIKNYTYNDKIINKSISLQHAGLYDNSDIIVNMNKPIQFIKIIFKSEDEKEIYKINCLKTEKMSSMKSKLEEMANKTIWNLKFNSNAIYDSDIEKRAEELGIKDKSVIYFS